ncbi:acetyltransferase [Colletotrichum graminicola]|uniref:Acetyltransferase n=1 Tax=Colletotrichum graminicola (strain M1.001 / M2 / FGSC 10212) TaxID=645133 RepID=E3QL82_COLGM|nr:acetyltransferase [Colletotrichum graminicola M1.001]EFQ31620.1 acetyltransferase [Colletotrichum graminicola M1.001]WDK10130.1 acetyltransferase [Colletotrichum graminicola]
MGTPFVSFLEPTRLDAYIRGAPHDEQPTAIPKGFCDAMEVREAVFVEEQKVPAENEFDADDSRACHWVAYASVNKVVEKEVLDAVGNIVKPRRSSTRSTPIGTIRLVPFPHAPHPKNGGIYWDGELKEDPDAAGPSGNTATTTTSPAVEQQAETAAEHVGEERRVSVTKICVPDRATKLHDGKEPYVKLGRLAVIPEFRGHRIARLLVTTALAWLRAHPGYFNPSIKEMGLEQMGAASAEEMPKWKGLVCVHAQAAVVGAWEKFGFQVDEEMGTWWEEGIEHKGMFMRLEFEEETPVL